MKQFFLTLFGGLFAIFVGLILAKFSLTVWHSIHDTFLSQISWSSVMTKVFPKPDDGTSISGIARTVRFTADEEEDLITGATLAQTSEANSKGISADGYIVENLTKGSITASHNADKLLPIASLSKLVTAVIARKMFDAADQIVISRDIMATYGNTAQFRVGERFSAANLIYPLLMVSSNDAAEAFARHLDRSKFIQAMNDFTQSIGAYRTYFRDPSGLSPQNVSTAKDMVRILNWIRMNDPAIINITLLKTKTVGAHIWVNPTHFLNWSNFLGGKNGYLPEANRTGAELFRMNKNDIYGVIVLGSSARDADVVKLLAKVE